MSYLRPGDGVQSFGVRKLNGDRVWFTDHDRYQAYIAQMENEHPIVNITVDWDRTNPEYPEWFLSVPQTAEMYSEWKRSLSV